MRIFDVHTHVFPDRIAQRAIAHLREKSRGIPAFMNGTAMDMERAALRAGYTGWMNCPVVTNLHQMRQANDWAAELNHWPHLSMGGLYVNAPMADVIAEVERIRQLGLYGIKFHPEYQEFKPLDPQYAPLWAAISQAGLPVLFHAGKDIGFCGLPQHSRPGDFARLAERYPDLTIICAHMGGWCDWDEVETELCGAPVYLDTSFSRPWMADQSQFQRIIRKHGVERVLFGTDAPWNSLEDGIQEVQNTDLTPQEQKMIFWDNAKKLFGLPGDDE